jgi:hypothetical protein
VGPTIPTGCDSRRYALAMSHPGRDRWADLDGSQSEVTDEMAEFRREMAELRSEVSSRLPKLMAVNIASIIGTAGLVLAAASLAH